MTADVQGPPALTVVVIVVPAVGAAELQIFAPDPTGDDDLDSPRSGEVLPAVTASKSGWFSGRVFHLRIKSFVLSLQADFQLWIILLAADCLCGEEQEDEALAS